MNRRGLFSLFLTLCLLGVSLAHATDYTSSHFIVRDSILGGGGGYATSSSFQLFSNGDFVLNGRTPSSGSFLGHFGFLYFPFVTTPTLTATVGDAQVDLSWATSDSGLGFTVSGYEYGIATTSGGPYTFFNVGNTTSTTVTGLTNFTTYYFVIRTLDTFGSPIVTSPQVSAVPTDGSTPPTPVTPTSGGHMMGVQFVGYAYPQAVVSVLKDAVLRATTRADQSGAFTLLLQEPYDQNVLYTLYADDTDGARSLLLNYPFIGTIDRLSTVDGIRFAPTIRADKIATKTGDPIVFSGFALPNTTISFDLTGAGTKTLTTVSKSTGRYELALPTDGFAQGVNNIRAHYLNDTRYTLTVQFSVGDANILPEVQPAEIPGDCNADHQITLQDFSVLAYWYGKPTPPTCIDTNSDGVVNLVDFSILAYYWNG